MDESGEHHPQQTDTRTENEIPHIFTHSRVRKNEKTWTQGREYYTSGSIGGNWEGQRSGSWGGIAWGEMPIMGEEQEGSKIHCHVCTYATILHVLHIPQNLKRNKKLKQIIMGAQHIKDYEIQQKQS